MRVIVPALNSALTSSTVPEPDTGEAAYNAGTTYALGARAISTSYHKIYESLQAANTGNAFPVPPETATDWWIEVGATNRYACVDLARNTQSISTTSPMVVTITPGERINALAVMGMEADTLLVQMYVNAVLKYEKSFDLKLRIVRDGYEYAFKPFDLQPGVAMFDIPPFSTGIITLTLTRTGSLPVKLGSVVAGTYVYLGKTQYNATNDGLNFSTIERDDYGTATLIPRRTLPKTSQTTTIEKAYVNDVLDARTRLNAIPAVWSGLDDQGSNPYFEALLILGVYQRMSVTLTNYEFAEVNLELEEI